jgi:diadenosine tetraphosphatase ApaH/serine/threonine PP2A family protein phosphatase
MKIIHYDIQVESRKTEFTIYPIGDIHLGANDVAETKLLKLRNMISKNPNARWVGGGDYCECIKPSELKRFDFESLPDWMFEGDAETIKGRLRDIVAQQKKRFYHIFTPIKKKCIGLIEGNHEVNLRKYHNLDHHGYMCDKLEVPDLTYEAFIVLRFIRGAGQTKRVVIFLTHGQGGGRRAGSAANKLEDVANMFRADIVLMGHNHQFCVAPPVVELGVPHRKTKDNECVQNLKYMGNWGTYRLSYKSGPSTYTSRALYKPRPISALEIGIIPFRDSGGKSCETIIQMREVSL